MSMSWAISDGMSAAASRRRWLPIFMATARAPMLLRICFARLSGTMPLGAASSTKRGRMRGGKPVAQPVQAEIRDRRNVNQNFRHHHEQDGEQQQLSGKADARLSRRPQRIPDCTWFAGRVQNHLSRIFASTR